ncbi:TetR family transcriptional regulator [Saccharopolyspora erythraea NRRL 2338]|nr:TetR/AcrR family transcriptional regulator [Saccharopolyspora erythraea]PFG96426.1 TetR family transcriptional regulator [Saccharopolyspora erythraea NRRL 2338]QRK92927.1 TetR/AcrR family transcriptional regulator [Saccharopolyspora erythraea]
MSPRGRPRAFDRDRAVRVAMELFWRRGFDGTSLSDLTTAIGISPPSLYSAFGSKEGLFHEAVELYTSRERAPIARAVREQPTARQVVEAMLRDSADAVTDPEAPRGCLVVLAATNTADEGVREFLAARRRKDHALVEQRLERGVAEGDLPASTDTAAMTTFLMTIQQGLSLQARDGRSRAELHAVVDRAMCAWDSLV